MGMYTRYAQINRLNQETPTSQGPFRQNTKQPESNRNYHHTTYSSDEEEAEGNVFENQEIKFFQNFLSLGKVILGGGHGMSIRFLKEEHVSRIAIISRLIVLFIQALVTGLLPNYLNDGFRAKLIDEGGSVFKRFLDGAVNSTFSGFANWDGQYFLHITLHGYTHENTIAFFPLFPLMVSVISTPLYTIWGSLFSYHSICIGVGWLLNTLLFERTAINLFRLTKYLDKGLENLGSSVIYLFCFNPASIFFSAFYSESIFAYLTTSTLLGVYKKDYKKALLFSSLSTIARSNGLLNIGFVLAMNLRDALSSRKLPRIYPYGIDLYFLVEFFKKATGIALALIPFILFQIYSKMNFCSQKYSSQYSTFSHEERHQFCSSYLPYAFVQKQNWNVGFLRYFEAKQIPNFILAAPVLYILFVECWPRFLIKVVRLIRPHGWKPNIFVDLASPAHGLFLIFFCLFFVHVQVSTRMILSSCPYLYIFIAKRIRKELYFIQTRQLQWPQYTLFIQCWFACYFLIGTIGFSLGLPWT